MKIYFKAAIKHNKELEDGMLKQVTEEYLFDAVSYTDAESSAYQWCEQNISGEFSIPRITKTSIDEVIEPEAEKFYTAKVRFATVDGDSNKEKYVNTVLLLGADDLDHSVKMIHEHLNSMLVPYEIVGVTLSKYVEVIRWEDKKAA